MPEYTDARVKISLATVDLADSTSWPRSLGMQPLKDSTVTMAATSIPLMERPIRCTPTLGVEFEAPFFLTQTSCSLPDDKPRALILKVDLTDCTTIAARTGLKSKAPRTKIEVFYNGELADCRYVPTSAPKQKITNAEVQIFAGRRVQTHFERPWVLDSRKKVPPGGQQQALNRHWDMVSQNCFREAVYRGTTELEDLAPVADFLMSLSGMKPPVVPFMDFDTKSPGIIDVVISLGFGQKEQSGGNSCCQPTRMRDPNYNLPRTIELMWQSPITHEVCFLPPPGATTSSFTSPTVPMRPDNHNAEITETFLQELLDTVAAPRSQVTTQASSLSYSPVTIPSKTATHKRAYETDSVANATPLNNVSAAHDTPGAKRARKSLSAAAKEAIGADRTTRPLATLAPKPSIPMPTVFNSEAPVVSSIIDSGGNNNTVNANTANHLWPCPEASRNSVFTYAEPHMVDNASIQPGRGVVRQVRRERTGQFGEERILCGARFFMY